ncbi:hypothetical protein [Oleiharenicola lentus]|uniref:hypothetical protein n=1 Tax=Oleiharenicola lentus TaxID=2508720 RepID=UPI003F66A379
MADGISRAFAWLRIITYLACLVAIWYLRPGAVSVYGLKYGIFDIVCGAYLARSTWILLRREYTS